ncbi:MAG: alginate lyase family protein [Pseudomonadota bacterium]|nr:alginate lyase family protein [Pseudomonadota bacterium]
MLASDALTAPGKLARFWRTIRHLKREQLIGRVRFRFAQPRIDCSPPPARRQGLGQWIAPALRGTSLIGPTRFRFLNHEADLDQHGWDDPALAKLWRYNLHYFDDLSAEGFAGRSAWHSSLIARWIAENAPPSGSGWEPYPVSLRIVNWIKWVLGGQDPTDEMLHSLAVQARWIERRLEWHLLGNHLFANAKALVFAGFFFAGDEAERWLALGRHILACELPEQILADGGQFELSPMYHAIALEDLLDLANLARTFGQDAFAEEMSSRVPAMLDWLAAMSHPDGEVAFFNDAAIGIAPDNIEMLRYAHDLGFAIEPPAAGITHHAQSGYARMELGAAVVIADLARIGPDYLPGHAHADTLSFEFSLGRKRFIVNSGTSVYGTSPERQRQRGTAAHSTLVFDGENSSEVWSGFRVGRRAKPFDVAVYGDETSLNAHGAHDGYTHLPGRPVHRRKWSLSKGQLLIDDAAEGSGTHQLEAYFHLGRGISAVIDAANRVVELRDAEGGRQATFSAEGGIVEVIPSSWHPEFGKRIDTKSIRVSAHQSLPHTLHYELTWSA